MRDQQTTTNPPEACAQNPDWRQDLSYALIESLMAEPEEQAKAFLKAHLERLPYYERFGLSHENLVLLMEDLFKQLQYTFSFLGIDDLAQAAPARATSRSDECLLCLEGTAKRRHTVADPRRAEPRTLVHGARPDDPAVRSGHCIGARPTPGAHRQRLVNPANRGRLAKRRPATLPTGPWPVPADARLRA